MPATEPRPRPVEDALQFIRTRSGAALGSRAEDVFGSGAEDAFTNLALEVFAFQFENNAPYQRLCRRRGVEPGAASRWEAIPAVPTAAFKAAELVAGPVNHVFVTSGTTRGETGRGRHLLPELGLYEASWPEPFRSRLLPGRAAVRMLSLIPSPQVLPESSLSFMVGRALDRFGSEGSGFFMDDRGLDAGGLCAALQHAMRIQEPVLILGTGLGLLNWKERLESSGERFVLPSGSRIMDTGGFKGRSGEGARIDLFTFYERRLGIPPCRVVGEYGMTELCSQFYEEETHATEGRRFVGPSWTRTAVLDPHSLTPVPAGESGLLAHWDLANAWSVTAVITEDLGIREGNGFRLLGRAADAELRGCSLATEELLGE